MKKLCSQCNLDLPVSEFSIRKRGIDGLQAWCRNCRREYAREYARKSRDLVAHRKSQRRYLEKNKHKRMAHSAVKIAIKQGVMIVPLWCQRCHCVSDLEAHHEDYSKPLEVVWLCTTCHGLIHRKYREVLDAGL